MTHKTDTHRGRDAFIILATALLLMVPAFLREPMSHDSFWINWVWADQFTSELARGNLYPRWLPKSHDGLGSPVFYYYPPLAFYLTGLLGLVGLSTYASIIGAFLVAMVGSGLTMRSWLRENEVSAPLFGALLFMAMPYHVLDFYIRGNIAEFLAIALLPLVAIGVLRAREGHFAVLAISYSALIMTHLPLALLVSLFFIAPYAFWLARDAPKTLLRTAIPILLGIGLAGIYLLPAVLLEPFRDAANLWADGSLKAENWSIWQWTTPGPPMGIRRFMASVILVLAFCSLVLIVAGQRLWAGYALACSALAAGLIPGFWEIPLLEAVQFPFRMLPLAEFGLATAAAQAALPSRLILAAIFPLFVPTAKYLLFPPEPTHLPLKDIVGRYPEVPENLPPGDRPHTWPSKWGLDLAREHRWPTTVDGRTVEPVFYFPAWEVRCDGRLVATAPEQRTQLLSYEGAGCDRRLVPTRPERIGAAISLAAFVTLLALAVWSSLASCFRRMSTARG